jgi:tRNA(Ile)-lysidine synthase
MTAEGLIRPLLDVARAEVEAYLRERAIPWREDWTNREEKFARNRIRHRTLPALSEEWNPQLREALAHLADLAYEEEHWWAAEIARRGAELLTVSPGAIELQASQLAAFPRAVARRLIRQAIRQAKGDLNGLEFGHIDRVIELARKSAGTGRLELPGIEAIRSFDWMRLAVPGRLVPVEPIPVNAPGRYRSPDGKSFICLDISAEKPGTRRYGTLKTSFAESLELRGWRPGDHYRPAGHTRDQKLKDLFQKSRVPSWQRLRWPILSSEGQIIWARQFGSAAQVSGLEASRFLHILEIPAGR